MATRTVTGTVLESDGTPWVGGAIIFELEEPTFNASNTFPSYSVSATTNSLGAFSVTLEAGLDQRYRCTLPDNSSFNFALPSGAGAVSIEGLRALDAAPETETSALQTLIDAHNSLATAHGLSTNISAALAGAASPTALNPFATMADVAGGGSSVYGSMYANNVTQAVEILLADTMYEIAGGFSAGACSGMTFQNSKELLVLTAGKYLINWQISFEIDSSNGIAGAVLINGSEALQTSAIRYVMSGDPDSVSGTGILTLAMNDLISLGLASLNSACNVVMRYANLTLLRLGA